MFFYAKECVAMILAGGKGSRLKSLTTSTAKPALPFGGKYRLIDFPLSNCANSAIDTIGILTQYQPLQLNEYLNNGAFWGLNSLRGGIHVLSPYSKAESSEWYKGTANSIFQNISFIERYNPEHVLILSGDHIYKMDYSKMLKFHKDKNADCTISVINVSKKDASRFGIMTQDKNNKILKFEEKPKNPQSTTASMGIYIFKWDILKDYLIKDNKNKDSSNDFGKDLIPLMLKEQKRLFAYEFSGFWQDVGTIESLWQTNMDILGETPKFNLNINNLKIYSGNYAYPPTVISNNASITNSVVSEGCKILGKVQNSVISSSVTIEKGATVINSFIMPNVFIGKNAKIINAIIGENAVIKTGATVGQAKSTKKAVVLKEPINNNIKNNINSVAANTTTLKNAVNLNLATVQNNYSPATSYESGIILNFKKEKIAVVGKDENVLRNSTILP